MEYTPRVLVPLVMLVSTALGGCGGPSEYMAPSAAQMYRDRMQYEYHARSQPQPEGLPAAALTDLPATLLLDIMPDPELDETLLSTVNSPG